jgi:hypothetical protein
MIEEWLSLNLEADSTTKTFHKAADKVKNCIRKGAAITLEHVPCLSAERRQEHIIHRFRATLTTANENSCFSSARISPSANLKGDVIIEQRK